MNVLVLSRNYPNPVQPQLGLWVEGLVRASRRWCQVQVVAAVPYCPPLPDFVGSFTRFRSVPILEHQDGISVYHPRFFTAPGEFFHAALAEFYYRGVRATVDLIHAQTPFDLIHAHFTYPDGVVAARLAQRYGIPLVITEHTLWRPWMDNYPRVRAQALAAHAQSFALIAASRSLRASIAHFTGTAAKLRAVPIGVDTAHFYAKPVPSFDPWQILYVGRIHRTKGVDVLLEAMHLLVKRGLPCRLVLVGGESLYRGWQREEARLRARAAEQVTFIGPRSPAQVAQLMRESALLVLPSRRESFGAVLVEALACGTPVVATRCGGPEDIIAEGLGLLVPPADPTALAEGIATLLNERSHYDSRHLSSYAQARYSWEHVAQQTVELYQEALTGGRTIGANRGPRD
ncbi:glycosyltransferase [Anthocerotibacter panamensis]|uniref:glycosyltransferase n=1 Tax=Anthocerotibacter panamensis TaxID=2857077 RepID=UPI001C402CA7|nr:glycosyltransferase [Anthocerotibacter panamensis]